MVEVSCVLCYDALDQKKGGGILADSNITKRALAASLKALMEDRPFSKISVGDICERCEMNRKSFYYHFRDKFDLVNWIYYTECIAAVRHREFESGWELFAQICAYFYENRRFYKKTLTIQGQNSFSEYLRELIVSIFAEELRGRFASEQETEFCVEFYADALLCAIKRWLLQKEPLPAQEFAALLRLCVLGALSKTGPDEENR